VVLSLLAFDLMVSSGKAISVLRGLQFPLGRFCETCCDGAYYKTWAACPACPALMSSPL
jgi:hypothetical protein